MKVEAFRLGDVLILVDESDYPSRPGEPLFRVAICPAGQPWSVFHVKQPELEALAAFIARGCR